MTKKQKTAGQTAMKDPTVDTIKKSLSSDRGGRCIDAIKKRGYMMVEDVCTHGFKNVLYHGMIHILFTYDGNLIRVKVDPITNSPVSRELLEARGYQEAIEILKEINKGE